MDWVKKILQKHDFKVSVVEIVFVSLILLMVGIQTGAWISQKKTKVIVEEQNNKIIDVINNNMAMVKNNIIDDQKLYLDQYKNITSPTPDSSTPTLTPTPTTQVLGESTTNIGMIQVKNGIAANIYENQDLNSGIINTVTSESILFYKTKEANWYLVDLLDQNKSGWIPAESVNEITY